MLPYNRVRVPEDWLNEKYGCCAIAMSQKASSNIDMAKVMYLCVGFMFIVSIIIKKIIGDFIIL
jgi:hypothetical protein